MVPTLFLYTYINLMPCQPLDVALSSLALAFVGVVLLCLKRVRERLIAAGSAEGAPFLDHSGPRNPQ